jgi:hypothetical protein
MMERILSHAGKDEDAGTPTICWRGRDTRKIVFKVG